MAKSIFKNFDLEDLEVSESQFDRFYFCELPTYAKDACANDQRTNSEQNITHLNNVQYIRLANITHDAFLIGYKCVYKKSYSHIHDDYTKDWERFWDCVSTGWIESDDLYAMATIQQLAGMCVLLALDTIISEDLENEFSLEEEFIVQAEAKKLRCYQFLFEASKIQFEYFGNAVHRNSQKAANKLHNKKGGSREKRFRIIEIWSSGLYTSRDICAEQECAALEMSFSTARKALRNTPEPTITLAPTSSG